MWRVFTVKWDKGVVNVLLRVQIFLWSLAHVCFLSLSGGRSITHKLVMNWSSFCLSVCFSTSCSSLHRLIIFWRSVKILEVFLHLNSFPDTAVAVRQPRLNGLLLKTKLLTVQLKFSSKSVSGHTTHKQVHTDTRESCGRGITWYSTLELSVEVNLKLARVINKETTLMSLEVFFYRSHGMRSVCLKWEKGVFVCVTECMDGRAWRAVCEMIISHHTADDGCHKNQLGQMVSKWYPDNPHTHIHGSIFLYLSNDGLIRKCVTFKKMYTFQNKSNYQEGLWVIQHKYSLFLCNYRGTSHNLKCSWTMN